MTPQEIFDKVYTHLVNQKVRSLSRNSNLCTYRGENGTKCAIGCLIPDELYDFSFEKKGISVLIENEIIAKLFSGIPINFLSDLQQLHDCAKVDENETIHLTSLKNSAILLAKMYNLSFKF